jgi:hypothetical protein
MSAFLNGRYLVTVGSDGHARTYRATDLVPVAIGLAGDVTAPAGAVAVDIAAEHHDHPRSPPGNFTLGDALWFALGYEDTTPPADIAAIRRLRAAEDLYYPLGRVEAEIFSQRIKAAGDDFDEFAPTEFPPNPDLDALIADVYRDYKSARAAVEPLVAALRRSVPEPFVV